MLLSETKEGLQDAIDSLNEFTDKWFLEINVKKTKCLVFSRGRKNKDIHDFKLGERILENCESYCYLGVIFNRSGSMKMASKALYDKAQGAMFSILRNINKHNSCGFNILIYLFDKMIVPILLYNSEVWGTSCLPINCNDNEFFYMSLLSRNSIENLQFKYLKMIMGVNKHTSNWGTITETGRFPLVIRVFTFMIKYLFHLINSSSPILNAALLTSIDLANRGVNSWFRGIRRVMSFCKLDHLFYTSDFKEIEVQLNNIGRRLKLDFISKWEKDKSELNKTKNKFELLVRSKDDFNFSEYLVNIKIASHRIAVTKLRLGSHGLPIETGRYEQKPREKRFCNLGCNKIGDEQHFLFECQHPFIKEERILFMNQLHQSFLILLK